MKVLRFFLCTCFILSSPRMKVSGAIAITFCPLWLSVVIVKNLFKIYFVTIFSTDWKNLFSNIFFFPPMRQEDAHFPYFFLVMFLPNKFVFGMWPCYEDLQIRFSCYGWMIFTEVAPLDLEWLIDCYGLTSKQQYFSYIQTMKTLRNPRRTWVRHYISLTQRSFVRERLNLILT